MSLDITPRYLWNKYITQALATLTASDAISTAPVSFLFSPDPNKKWNSYFNFTIVTGFNDTIPIGSTEVVLTAGNYTGTELAAHVLVRLEAVVGGGGWSCTFNVAGPNKFRINNSSPFVFKWTTTANPGRVAGYDLGFNASVDSASSASHISVNSVYQSRHYVQVDLGSSKSLQCAVVYKHNVASTGSVTVLADDTPNWTTPSLSQALSGTYTGNYPILLAFFGTVSKRYVRFVFNDCQNSQASNQAGIIYAGPYSQMTRGFKPGSQETARSLSQFEMSDQGSVYQNSKGAGGKQFQLNYSKIKGTDKTEIDAMWEAVGGMGGMLFLAKDPQNNPATDTHYGYFSQEPVYTWAVADGTPALRYDVSLQFQRHIA